MKGIVLVVVQGPDAGRRFAIAVGHYRVIARQEGMFGGTAIVSHGEQRRLEREDQRMVAEHLRARAAPGLIGARNEVAAFTRDEDLELGDEAVSQTHAMVFVDEAGASVVDIASTNGTWVNSAKVSESVIVPHDLLRVGETRFDVELF